MASNADIAARHFSKLVVSSALGFLAICVAGCEDQSSENRSIDAKGNLVQKPAEGPSAAEVLEKLPAVSDEEAKRHVHLYEHAALDADSEEEHARDSEEGPGLSDIPENLGELNEETIELIATVIKQAQGGTQFIDGLFQAAAGLSDEKLYGYGKMFYDLHLEGKELVTKGPYVERAVKVAEPMFKIGTREFKYTISVVDSEAINAYATAGGFVYLNKGLMDVLNDKQLLFVIGHEVAHVELRHTDSIWTYASRLGLLTGDNLGMVVASLMKQHIQAGFNEEQELDSDEWGFLKSKAMGVSGKDAIQAFVILAESHGREIKEEEDSETVVEELEKQVDHHYRTHPSSFERIKQIERLSSGI